jgi:hypothetical protein
MSGFSFTGWVRRCRRSSWRRVCQGGTFSKCKLALIRWFAEDRRKHSVPLASAILPQGIHPKDRVQDQ